MSSDAFLASWHEAALTSCGFFWTALWAFVLGYVLSSLIQVLVTRERMSRLMGADGPRSVGLGALFGFVSSSCSFAALSTTRALFQKGAGLASALAFLLASTNLVIELGIVISLFLGWPFVLGEYVGGALLVLWAWGFVRVTRPTGLVRRVRERLAGDEDDDGEGGASWREVLGSRAGWRRIATTYVMEWNMVWKDVLIGFTVAGVIAAFVPDAFFEALFVGSGDGQADGFGEVLVQTVVGPVAAFFTFIGSMGNIPLAALLYDHGVSFAGVMAFLFSDLVVLPVLRINAGYYGWPMALYILGLLLSGLVAVSLALHYGLAALGWLPDGNEGSGVPRAGDAFALDTGFVLDVVALVASAVLGWLWWRGRDADGHGEHDHGDGGEPVLSTITALAGLWLVGGLAAGAVTG